MNAPLKEEEKKALAYLVIVVVVIQMSSLTCRPLLSSPISIHSLIIISLSVIKIQQKDEILKNHTFKKKEEDQNTISFLRLLSVQKDHSYNTSQLYKEGNHFIIHLIIQF